MEIRAATGDELAAVSKIYHEVWHETHANFMPIEEVERRSLAFFDERVAHLYPNVIVAADIGVVGFAAWKDTLLGQIFVRASHRGAGIAAPLLAATERAMRANGARDAELHCVVGNDRARRFYERCGWRCQGEIHEEIETLRGTAAIPFWQMVKSL